MGMVVSVNRYLERYGLRPDGSTGLPRIAEIVLCILSLPKDHANDKFVCPCLTLHGRKEFPVSDHESGNIFPGSGLILLYYTANRS